MALWSVRASQAKDLPPRVKAFLSHHEREEQAHLRAFETMLGTRSIERDVPPKVPSQWAALAVHLYGYETLGLEFAKRLVLLRPDLVSVLHDEERHVGFLEREIRQILAKDQASAETARRSTRSWWRKVPNTVRRYLKDEAFTPIRQELQTAILLALRKRLCGIRLLESAAHHGDVSHQSTGRA